MSLLKAKDPKKLRIRLSVDLTECSMEAIETIIYLKQIYKQNPIDAIATRVHKISDSKSTMDKIDDTESECCTLSKNSPDEYSDYSSQMFIHKYA